MGLKERKFDMEKESVAGNQLEVKKEAEIAKETDMEKSVEEEVEMDTEKGAGMEQELSELEQENERLRRENELLKEYRASLPLKERFYDRVPLTVKQLDIIIGVLLAGLIFVVALGMLDR